MVSQVFNPLEIQIVKIFILCSISLLVALLWAPFLIKFFNFVLNAKIGKSSLKTESKLNKAIKEITKDIEDTKKDKDTKRTLPMIVGVTSAKLFVVTYYLLAIMAGIEIYLLFLLNAFYLVFILLSSAVFIYSILLLFKNKFKESQSMAKVGMIFSMVSFILILL